MVDLSGSQAAQILASDPDRWNDPNVRTQYLKDWVNVPRLLAAPPALPEREAPQADRDTEETCPLAEDHVAHSSIFPGVIR